MIRRTSDSSPLTRINLQGYRHILRYPMLAFALIIAFTVMSPRPAQCEEINESFTVQFSGSDLLTIEKGIQEALEKEPVTGESSEPLKSPSGFGTITARGIQYSFSPLLHNTQLLDSALKFDLSIRNFRGRIAKLELNESGSRSCTNLEIHSPSNEIPVTVIVHPKVNSAGLLELQVSQANFELNERNFKVNYPGRCDVMFGLNWLVKWTLPWLIESYKETIEEALSSALAKGLRERTAELSPLLSLNITLPFQEASIPAFYATVGVRPFNVDVNKQRIRSAFSTSIKIDPDIISPFGESGSWPNDFSFLGMSWEFLNGLFREAQTKGIIKVLITRQEQTQGLGSDRWLEHSLWQAVWPDFINVVPTSKELQLLVLGGSRYNWMTRPDAESGALLVINDLRVRLQTQSEVLAEFVFNVQGNFIVSSDSMGRINASIASVGIANLHIAQDSGLLSSHPIEDSALQNLSQQIELAVSSLPADKRELFNIKIPSLKIGNHQILIRDIMTHDAGLILPLRYVTPQ